MKNREAFSLVELLVVLSMLGVLAALLFPAFAQAREEGRRTSCLSNLHQIGGAIAIYTCDYDEHIPYAVDAATLQEENNIVTDLNLAVLNRMPLFVPTIQPYLKSTAVLRCPSEHPFGYEIDGYFNDFQKYGSSYSYAIYPAYLKFSIEDFNKPAEQYLAAEWGDWHSGGDLDNRRKNSLFADFHVKSVPEPYFLATVVPFGL